MLRARKLLQEISKDYISERPVVGVASADDFASVETSQFDIDQSLFCARCKSFHSKEFWPTQIRSVQHASNVVRDQGVGGSNPLFPTIFF